MAKHEEVKKGHFPQRGKYFWKSFIGQSYYKALVADPKVSVGVGNATFEPRCRNNWHIHRCCFL
jgi:quercetin dioxygenase-like cupin family protein